MKTKSEDLIHSFNHTDNSEGNKDGLTKREYIAIEMHKSILNGLLSAVKDGEYHGWSPDDIASNALLQTDAIINALNDNP